MTVCLSPLADVQSALTPTEGEGDRSPDRFLSSLSAELQLLARPIAYRPGHSRVPTYPGKEGTSPGNIIF
jgi:hypothetical protein